MTVDAEQIADTGAHTATTQWQRRSTSMQIVVTDPDSLAVARREVDAELDPSMLPRRASGPTPKSIRSRRQPAGRLR
jgi:hypothetical protein